MAKLRDAFLCPVKTQEAVQHLNTCILLYLILVCEIRIPITDVLFFSYVNRKYKDGCRISEHGSAHSSGMMCQYF